MSRADKRWNAVKKPADVTLHVDCCCWNPIPRRLTPLNAARWTHRNGILTAYSLTNETRLNKHKKSQFISVTHTRCCCWWLLNVLRENMRSVRGELSSSRILRVQGWGGSWIGAKWMIGSVCRADGSELKVALLWIINYRCTDEKKKHCRVIREALSH